MGIVSAIIMALRVFALDRTRLAMENLALRQQLAVYRESRSSLLDSPVEDLGRQLRASCPCQAPHLAPVASEGLQDVLALEVPWRGSWPTVHPDGRDPSHPAHVAGEHDLGRPQDQGRIAPARDRCLGIHGGEVHGSSRPKAPLPKLADIPRRRAFSVQLYGVHSGGATKLFLPTSDLAAEHSPWLLHSLHGLQSPRFPSQFSSTKFPGSSMPSGLIEAFVSSQSSGGR